jgi:uncharacterized damage-inducible protein DinB
MTIVERIDWLLAYTDWDRAKWEAWFGDHPEALGASYGPNADGKIANVGELVRHIFAAEQRFSDRIEGKQPGSVDDVPADDTRALFDLGRRTRANFQRVLRDTPDSRWHDRFEMQLGGARPLSIVYATMPAQIVTHEVRHWAHVALLVRLAGFRSGLHDILVSGVFESSQSG